MPTVFLDAVFKPFLKIVPDTGQQLTIDPTNFLTYGFLQIVQRTGVCECKHAISNTPQRKKNHTLKYRESEGATARLRNGKWGARETCIEQCSLTRCSTGQVAITTEVANPEEKNADHLVPPCGPPTEYYPFKRCPVPMGHPVVGICFVPRLKQNF